jgi:SAM-dependent methyltransferase
MGFTMVFLALTFMTMILSFGHAFEQRTWSFVTRASSANFLGEHDSKKFQICQRVTRREASSSRLIGEFEASDFAEPTGSWPYTDMDMARVDSSNDANFYDTPRFVTHIDDRAIQSLTEYYRDEFQSILKSKKRNDKKAKLDVMDLCSSWISHLPDDISYGRVVGIGMNEAELKANKQLTEYAGNNLNVDPSLAAYDDNSFDVVCNVVSVDYLTKPREIFQELHRILRPGGVALMSFSNRCFPTKAVSLWLREDDVGRLSIVGSYFHYSAQWSSIEAYDIKLPPLETPKRPGFGEMFKDPAKGYAWAAAASFVAQTNAGDPILVVKGTK